MSRWAHVCRSANRLRVSRTGARHVRDHVRSGLGVRGPEAGNVGFAA